MSSLYNKIVDTSSNSPNQISLNFQSCRKYLFCNRKIYIYCSGGFKAIKAFSAHRGGYFSPLLELYSVEDVEEKRHKIDAITLDLSLPINPFKRHPWRWAIIKYLHCSHALKYVGRKPRQQIRHNHKTTVVNLLLFLE